MDSAESEHLQGIYLDCEIVNLVKDLLSVLEKSIYIYIPDYFVRCNMWVKSFAEDQKLISGLKSLGTKSEIGFYQDRMFFTVTIENKNSTPMSIVFARVPDFDHGYEFWGIH